LIAGTLIAGTLIAGTLIAGTLIAGTLTRGSGGFDAAPKGPNPPDQKRRGV
jgi:hypothetical protein